jgi:hypothetical protein
MHCPEVRDLLQPFLDGELEVDRNVSMLKHLELCPPCRCRADEARALHELVSRAACEKVCAEGRARLLGQAYTRCEDDPTCRGRASWRRRAVMAAVLLVTFGGLGAMGVKHRACLTNCQMKRVIARAHQLSLLERPIPPEELVRRFGPSFTPLQIEHLSCEGGVPWTEGNCPNRPILRYHCNCDGATIVVFSIDNAHVHFWQMKRLDDGRDWVVLEEDGIRVLGWFDEANSRLWCFIGQSEVPNIDTRLYVLAGNVRKD